MHRVLGGHRLPGRGPESRPGRRHFLEHLLFKGTADRSAAAIAEAVDEVGGDFNAFTTKEYTSFYIRLLAEHLALGLDILSDIMWRPALRPGDLDAERQVILDEILMHADEPSDEAAEQSSAPALPGPPARPGGAGQPRLGGGHDAERIAEFFAPTTAPETWWWRWPATSTTARSPRDSSPVRRPDGGATPERVAPGDKVEPLAVSRRATDRPIWCWPPGRSTDWTRSATRWPWSTTCWVEACPAGCSRRSVSDAGLAYSVWSERVAYHDVGSVSVGMGTAPEHVTEVLDIVSTELDRLGAEGITERELAIAKGNLRAETLLACEDSGARMSRIGAGLLLHGEILTVDEVLERVAALTLEEVHAAAAELVAAPRTLSVVGPFDESDFDARTLRLG